MQPPASGRIAIVLKFPPYTGPATTVLRRSQSAYVPNALTQTVITLGSLGSFCGNSASESIVRALYYCSEKRVNDS